MGKECISFYSYILIHYLNGKLYSFKSLSQHVITWPYIFDRCCLCWWINVLVITISRTKDHMLCITKSDVKRSIVFSPGFIFDRHMHQTSRRVCSTIWNPEPSTRNFANPHSPITHVIRGPGAWKQSSIYIDNLHRNNHSTPSREAVNNKFKWGKYI